MSGNHLIIYRDRRLGEDGAPGTDGVGVSDISTSDLENPICDIFYNNNLSKVGDLTFSRDGEALFYDRYGRLKWVPASSITNKTIRSSQYLGFWLDVNSSWTAVTGEPDPFGGSNAEEITIDLDTTLETYDMIQTPTSVISKEEYHTISFWMRVKSGTVASLDVIVDGNIIQSDESVTATFERFTFNVAADSSSSVSINPRCAAGTKVVLFGFMSQIGSVATDYIPTTTVPVTSANPNAVYRENRNGYYIEGTKENIAKHSENLQKWSISSGSISSATDPFGFKNKQIKINWSTIPTIEISQLLTFAAGADYTISFYVHLTAGSVSAATCQIGSDGEVVSLPRFSTSGFERVSAKLTAGTTGNTTIYLTSPSVNGVPLITNIQVELGELTSYVRNNNGINSRSRDDVSLVYLDSAPYPNSAFTFYFSLKESAVNSDLKYIFSNALSGSDNFSTWFQDEFLKVQNGTEVASFNITDQNSLFFLTFDGAALKLYKGSVLQDSFLFTSTSKTISTDLEIGSDGLSNEISAFLSTFSFFDFEFSEDDIKYMASGV